MKVRAIDSLGDWLFGKGFNDYKSQADAVAQDLRTRLNSWLGNCFFDQAAGLNYKQFLGGSKSQLQFNLSVSAVILNTSGVTALNQLAINLSDQRRITIQYSVVTSYGPSSGTTSIAI